MEAKPRSRGESSPINPMRIHAAPEVPCQVDGLNTPGDRELQKRYTPPPKPKPFHTPTPLIERSIRRCEKLAKVPAVEFAKRSEASRRHWAKKTEARVLANEEELYRRFCQPAPASDDTRMKELEAKFCNPK